MAWALWIALRLRPYFTLHASSRHNTDKSYLAFMSVCDFYSCRPINILQFRLIWSIFTLCDSVKMLHLSPPGIVSVTLFLTTHSSTSLTTFYQIREVLCKPKSNYTWCNGLKHTRHHESLKQDPLCPEDYCRHIDRAQASSIPRSSCLLRPVELCPVNMPAQGVCTQRFLHISSSEIHGAELLFSC